MYDKLGNPRQSQETFKDLLMGFAILAICLWFVWAIEQDRNSIRDPSGTYEVDR